MKYTPGPLIAAASGSVGGTTFSRNRYGAYCRTRAIPVNPNTIPQQNARSRLSTFSANWQLLTATQRLSWKMWALQNPIVNTLGAQQELTGQAAYVGLNTRLAQASEPAIDIPPLVPAPTSLVTLTGEWDIGPGAFELAFTATPLAADARLWCQACVVNSPGISYVKNLLRVVVISAAEQATGLDISAEIEAVFGDLVIDQTVHVWCSVLGDETGLLSVPLSVSGVVIDTT